MVRTSKRSSVEAEIARLPDLGIAKLRERWIELYGRPGRNTSGATPRPCPRLPIQVKAFGGLSEATKQWLREIAAAPRDGPFDTADLEPRSKPGTS